MEAAKLHNEILKGYAVSTPHEWERLTLSNGIMEYITTIHYLGKYLPKNGVVADIGSGPGRYSLWLAHAYGFGLFARAEVYPEPLVPPSFVLH